MSCNPTKKDYYHNNNKYVPIYGQAYQVLNFAERYTASGDCSPRDHNGKLILRENNIDRKFNNQSGIPGITVVTQFGDTSLGYIFGYGSPLIEGLHFKEQALASALARFKKQAQEKAILAMEYLAERKTLADDLLRLVKRLLEFVKLAKQRRFKTIWTYSKRAGKKVANRKEMTFHEKWLEVHFSIMPMVDDIVKNINGLKELHAAKLRKRGFYNELVRDSGRNYINEYESTLLYTYRVSVTGEVVVTDPLAATQSLIGLNPSDFYDVIPFSFLLDWCFNIGQIIKGLMIPGIAYVNTAITTLEKSHTEHWGKVNPSLDPTVAYSQIGGSYYESSAHYSRVAGPLPDIPLVWAGGIDSLWRVITSIALARSIFNS